MVTEKYADFYMSNPAAGYNNIHERWAVRISNNGEFIHANPASSGAQGNTNVTNGCINLSTADAEQYFNTAVYGDPVEVTGTSIEPVLRRRRHLGLGGGLGPVGPMSALSGEAAVERRSEHRPITRPTPRRCRHPDHHRRIRPPTATSSSALDDDVVGHPVGPAVEPAPRAWSRGRMTIWSRVDVRGRTRQT